MAPSFAMLGAAALAYASGAAALVPGGTEEFSYQLTDKYDATNFFTKFKFFQVSWGLSDPQKRHQLTSIVERVGKDLGRHRPDPWLCQLH